ncbi:hypothetical protein G3488_10545 [Shewanella baltica]|uniref:hypothetical protein n=1 Tax=Shewanella baltica TaxID=62322 RepID=UPI002877E3B5|nr:hypothetical protein [Shewanella baltica]MCS6231291.1 hypothetical protein [Shewanella baltica]
MSALGLAMISPVSSAHSASLPTAKSVHQPSEMVEPSGLQSFTYGALGLAAPKAEPSSDVTAMSKTEAPTPDDAVPNDTNDSNDTYYSAGQILKAAATVGSVIALFV